MKCWCGGETVFADATPGGVVCADSKFHDPFATGKPEHISRLYVAGPMSGYEDCNYPAFTDAKVVLEKLGYDVVSPADFGGLERCHYVDLIREDLRAMLDCHAVATLDGWWESVGARNEVQVAGILKMPVRSVYEWSARAEFELKERFNGYV